MDNADDVFGLLFVNRQARILVIDEKAEDLVEIGVGRHRNDGVARHHDLSRCVVVQVEHVLDTRLQRCSKLI